MGYSTDSDICKNVARLYNNSSVLNEWNKSNSLMEQT